MITNNQKLAMDAREGNYLVSASAGSGKTFVLTQRVFEVIKEGTNLNELLILTFTNLAASEMRDRIRGKLVETGDPKLFEIASSLDAANIQTYDAYALNIVKKYYYRIGLAKDISLIDQNILELEERKILDKILNEYFDKKDESVLKLINDYCLKNSDDLKEFIIAISHKFDLKEDKKAFLDNYVSTFFNPEKITKDVNDFILEINANIAKFISKIKTFENVDYIDAVEPILEKLNSCHDYESLKNFFENEENKFPALRGALSLKDYPDDKNYHAYMKDSITKYSEIIRFIDMNDLIEQYLGTKDNVETLIRLVRRLDEEINNFKAKYSVYSFADIFKFALQIISISDINYELKNRYKYIMIDEYQDTSDIQEKFINKIANNNVYVVGDVKQSIYRFRNANCDLFLDKFINYGKGISGKRIELPENFRSRKEVLDAVNKIFSTVMNVSNTGLDYEKEHKMQYGNLNYDNFVDPNSNYECEILPYQLGNTYLSAEHEARLIATDIAKKIKNKFMVFDKDINALREVEYRDFAIIMYAKKYFPIYQKVFNEYQIPLFANYNKSIRENNLTMTFENIISLLSLYEKEDYSKKFLHSFISVLRSFLFECDDESVEQLAFDQKYERFPLYEIIQRTSLETKGSNLKEKIAAIIRNFDIYQKLIKIGDVSNNASLLEYYYSVASQMDNMGYDIQDFKNFFDDLKEFEIDPEFSPTDDVENCVKLLSIHASKGLQFKICYFAELYRRFNSRSYSNKMLVDDIYGIDIPNVYHKEISSFYHDLIKNKEKKEMILEQLRVFYVALTRAEEKIIMLKNVDFRKNEIQDFAQCSLFLDFLSLAGFPFNKYELEIESIKRTLEENKDELGVINIETPKELSKELRINKHASKELDADTDNELLLLGSKYHYYLELVDFNTKDASFIRDENDRKRIVHFLSNPIFKNSGVANVMHEYPFYDEKNNINGVIDLMLEYEDHIDIIDFKLSHVDDEEYEKQVETYKKYISSLTKKEIHTYVTGIISGDVKQVS